MLKVTIIIFRFKRDKLEVVVYDENKGQQRSNLLLSTKFECVPISCQSIK